MATNPYACTPLDQPSCIITADFEGIGPGLWPPDTVGRVWFYDHKSPTATRTETSHNSLQGRRGWVSGWGDG